MKIGGGRICMLSMDGNWLWVDRMVMILVSGADGVPYQGNGVGRDMLATY